MVIGKDYKYDLFPKVVDHCIDTYAEHCILNLHIFKTYLQSPVKRIIKLNFNSKKVLIKSTIGFLLEVKSYLIKR